MIVILLELTRFYCTFPEPYHAVGQWLNTVSGKPAPAPPSGSFFKLMKHFLYRLFSRKGTIRLREKEICTYSKYGSGRLGQAQDIHSSSLHDA